jgi:hypothetical protein
MLLTRQCPRFLQWSIYTIEFTVSQRDHFTIGSLRGKAPLAQAPISQHSFQMVFYPAKHRDDKVFQRHGGLSVRLRWLVPLSLAQTLMPLQPALSLYLPSKSRTSRLEN